MTLTVLWAGELGGRVARLEPSLVRAVTATTRRHPDLRANGANPQVEWPVLSSEDRVLLSLSGSATQLDAVRRLAPGPVPERAVLVSTLGYHHPYQGTVGPDSPAGRAPRAMAAAATEHAFRNWAGPAGVIVRCAGLWHASRGPLSAFARNRSAPLGPPDAVLPLIHYDDAAALVHAALTHSSVPPVLLGVVCTPTRQEFYDAASEFFGCPAPAFTDPIGVTARFEDPAAAALLGSPRHADWREALGPVER